MNKKLLLTLPALAISAVSFAQFSSYDTSENSSFNPASSFTLSSGSNTLEISGIVAAYYQDRILKSGQTDKKHNTFAAKDANIDLLGKTGSGFKYELEISLLDLVSAASVANTTSSATAQAGSNVSPNSQNTGFKSVYVAYEGSKLPFHVKLGYDKLPYSMGSLNDVVNTPFWSHPNLVGGDFFSRRDLGITLYQRFWKSRIGAYAGVYSGLGENIFEYTGDASGRPEYVGRVDVSYPSKYKYDLIDESGSPIPVFRIGINARYTDKTQPAGSSVYVDAPDASGAYGIRVINGKRLAYGGDFIIKYKGISATFEAHVIDMRPTSPTDNLYAGTPVSFNNNHVMAGGFTTGVNYNWLKIHSVFSVSYEDINANDLIKGDAQWLNFAYAYKISGFNSVFKIQYYIPVQEDAGSDPLKYTGQIRLGYQLVF